MRTTLANSALNRWRVPLFWLGVGLCVLALAWFVIQEPSIGSLLAVSVIAPLLCLTVFFERGAILSFRRALVPMLAVAVLFPYIRLPAGMPNVRLEWVIMLTGWALIILGHLVTGHPIRLRRCPTHKWFLLFGLCILVSTTVATLVGGQSTGWRDLWEVGKPIMFLALLLLASSTSLPQTSFRRIYWSLMAVLLVSAAVGWAQFWNIFDINTCLVPLYRSSSLALMEGWARRIVGTTGNPNSFAALMVFAGSLALAGALWLKRRIPRLMSWGALACFSFSIVLTASRTGLIALVVACAMVLLVRYPLAFGARGAVRVALFLVPAVAFGVAITAPFLPAGFKFRLADAFQPWSATSMVARIDRWQEYLSLWWQSPIFGLGPAKALVSTNVDNEFLLVLARYGIVGLAVFVGLYGSLYLSAARASRSAKTPEAQVMGVALEATIVGYIPYMALAGVYHDLQLMSITLIVLGVALSQSRGVQRRDR